MLFGELCIQNNFVAESSIILSVVYAMYGHPLGQRTIVITTVKNYIYSNILFYYYGFLGW